MRQSREEKTPLVDVEFSCGDCSWFASCGGGGLCKYFDPPEDAWFDSRGGCVRRMGRRYDDDDGVWFLRQIFGEEDELYEGS